MKCASCDRAATRFVIYEATLAPGILPRRPHKWMCEDHCKQVWAEVLIKHEHIVGVRSVLGRVDVAEFAETFREMRRRSPGAWKEREAQDEPIPILLCPSKLTEVEVRELQQAWDDGRTIREGCRPRVEIVTPEEAAREIAGMN